MSRFSDYEGDDDDGYNGAGWAMWEKRADLALHGKRGRAALVDLRAALLALPEKRLIESALCTVGAEQRVAALEAEDTRYGTSGEVEELRNLIDHQGEGVCAIGAYVWFQKVKGGMDPAAAFADLPTVAAFEGGTDHETAAIGKAAGLTYTLAWELASQNDETFAGLTPEQRYVAFVGWIDKELARPPLKAPERGAKARRRAERIARRVAREAEQARKAADRQAAAGQIALPL